MVKQLRLRARRPLSTVRVQEQLHRPRAAPPFAGRNARLPAELPQREELDSPRVAAPRGTVQQRDEEDARGVPHARLTRALFYMGGSISRFAAAFRNTGSPKAWNSRWRSASSSAASSRSAAPRAYTTAATLARRCATESTARSHSRASRSARRTQPRCQDGAAGPIQAGARCPDAASLTRSAERAMRAPPNARRLTLPSHRASVLQGSGTIRTSAC